MHPITTKATVTSLAISSKRQPFFGSSLKDLLLDELHCHYSYLNPLVGIPHLANAMISFIHANIDTKGLFRTVPAPSELCALKQRIEEDRALPMNSSVAAVTTLFIQV